jgi:hypothetical protein
MRAVRGRKIRYYRDAAFAVRRGVPAAAVPELVLERASAPSFAELVSDADDADPSGRCEAADDEALGAGERR